MKIIVDAMGGDNAPVEIVLGSLDAVKELGVEVVLVGRGEAILKVLNDNGYNQLPKGVAIANAETVVEMHDDPASVVKTKPDSSLVQGVKMLSEGVGEAFVSAGNTGAMLAAATLYVKRIKGIRRAALCPFVPTKNGHALLIDCGANVECTPEYLLQFAFMGSFYYAKQKSCTNPRVGLLNIGTEETKGAPLQKEAFQSLKKASQSGKLNFVGNIEGRDVAFGHADVVVADGYSGNIFLKTTEGIGLFFADVLKSMFKKNLVTKIAALLVKTGISDFKKMIDYTETGGSPLLGLAKPVIKAHGSSNAKAIKNAIRQAKIFAEANVIQEIEKNIEHMKISE